MQQLVLMFHVIIAIALVVLVLLQQGKGAEMGAAFGSGASQTLFGSQGSGSFLLKITGLLAALFFSTSLLLGYIAAHQSKVDPLQQHLIQLEQEKSAAAQEQPVPAAVQSPALPAAGVPLTSTNENELKQQLPVQNSKPVKSK